MTARERAGARWNMRALLIILALALTGCGFGRSVYLERTWTDTKQADCTISVDRDILTEQQRYAEATCTAEKLSLVLRDMARTDAKGVKAAGGAVGEAAGAAAKAAVGVP